MSVHLLRPGVVVRVRVWVAEALMAVAFHAYEVAGEIADVIAGHDDEGEPR